MKLIKQTCEPYIQSSGIGGIYKQIERCGRTCYKSESNITEDSAKPFVDRMIKSNHLSMLEHGTVYLLITYNSYVEDLYNGLVSKYLRNPYSKVNFHPLETDIAKPLSDQKIGEKVKVIKLGAYITTNMRVIIENKWDSDLKFLCDPTKFHIKRYTFRCTTALHCYKDLTRHRKFSFAIESTRYCNYSNTGKFGEMTFILPTWIKEPADTLQNSDIFAYRQFYEHLENVEKTYDSLIEEGWKAQEAAEVLPQCIKADMIITGFEGDWKHLLDLRYKGTTGAPHPMVKELATLIKNELEKQGFKYEC